ncbi:hypothetical protein KYC_02484 [Achromobacter arsenitoxydans SY8]|uniref:Uncharacterized protein n=2 Tax=Achromobacter TaxID=222 RepID=H0F163_9BURK|nr:hypothetical protein KYC_02484 [Achromobacter arsenitoxydans SY8]
MLDAGLEKIRDTLRPKLAGLWAIRVTLIGPDKEPFAYAPQARMGLCEGPHTPDEINHLGHFVMFCIDQLFASLQTNDQLNKRFVAESYVAADISAHDVVHYEISKHHDPNRLQSAYSTLIAHHHRLALESKDEATKLDHLLTGYQTAAAIERPTGYSASTLDQVAFFRAAVESYPAELRSLSIRKKSSINFHLLTVEEGFAELYSYVSLAQEAEGTIAHIRFQRPPGKEIEAGLEAKLQRIHSDQSTPYSRGLALYKTLYDRHGYAFSVMAKTLCEANFKIMGNLLPFYVLSKANDQTFPHHPTALLEKLSGFECSDANACAKIAAAVPYLQLDARSPQDIAIDVLEQL